MTNMQPTKQDRITSVLRKIRAYQNKPIVVAPGEGVECVRLNPIEAILLANHITHLEDMIATLENLVSEHENDVGVYKRRAIKLEGQVLALREAEARTLERELRMFTLPCDPEEDPSYIRGFGDAFEGCCAYFRTAANRLRNGGSDGE